MERIKQLLGRARFKLASDLDYRYSFNLENKNALLKNNLNKIVTILSQEDVFRQERIKSKKHRVTGKLNIITDNKLTYGEDKYPTTEDWSPKFNGNVSNLKTDPNNWVLQVLYPSSIDKYTNLESSNQAYRGVNINKTKWVTSKMLLQITTTQNHGLIEGDYCYIYSINKDSVYTGVHKVEFLGENGNDTETTVRLNTKFTTDESDEKLLLKRVSKPSSYDLTFSNTQKPIKVSICDQNGIDVSITNPTANYVKIITGDLTSNPDSTHGLREGDYVDIRVKDNNFELNGLHRVEKIINRYGFVIDLKLNNPIPPNPDFDFRRMSGTPSDYYIRKFEVLTGNGYDVTRATSFGSNIYPETQIKELGVSNLTWLFTFLDDIDLTNVYSHRGGQVTELYLATIKMAGDKPYPWGPVTAHWDFQKRYADKTNKLETISNYNWGNNGDGVGSLNKILNGPSYIGDFVEFNRSELKEKTLSEIIHRWGLYQDENIDLSGYETEEQLLRFSIEDETPEPKKLVYGWTLPNNNSLLVYLPKTPWTFRFSINITPRESGFGGSTPIDTTTKYWIRWRVRNHSSNIDIQGLEGPLQGKKLDYHLFDLTQTGSPPYYDNQGGNYIYIYVYSEKPLNVFSSLNVENTTSTYYMYKENAALLRDWYGDKETFGKKPGTGSRKKTDDATVASLNYSDDVLSSLEVPTDNYYIYPFHRVDIRKFSNVIETVKGTQKVVGIPGDAEKRPNGDTIWRDVLEPGYIEDGNNGVDFPFLNGSNYIFINKDIFIRKRLLEGLGLKKTDEGNNTNNVEPIQIC